MCTSKKLATAASFLVFFVLPGAASAQIDGDNRPPKIESFQLDVQSPVRVLSNVRLYPRVEGFVPNGRSFPLVATLTIPGGKTVEIPVGYQLTRRVCRGCDPPPGASADICDNACSWEPVSTAIELPVQHLKQPGTYQVVVTGDAFGSARATFEALDPLAWRQHQEAKRKAHEQSLIPAGPLRHARLARACSDVKVGGVKAVDFDALPAPSRKAWKAPRRINQQGLVGGGVLAYLEFGDTTLWGNKIGSPERYELSRQGERVVRWAPVDGGVAYGTAPKGSTDVEYSWVKPDGTGHRAFPAEEFPTVKTKARNAMLRAKEYRTRDTWEIDDRWVFGAAIHNRKSIALIYDRARDEALLPPKSLEVKGYGAMGRDNSGILFGAASKDDPGNRRAYYLDPFSGTAYCVSSERIFRGAFYLMSLSGMHALVRTGSGNNPMLRLVELGQGVEYPLGTLNYGSRMVPLSNGRFLVTNESRQLHTFIVDAKTRTVKRLAQPFVTRFKGGGNITVAPDESAVLIGEHVIEF